jgi:phosphatidylinositol alpha-1,6-mannosyltransferase
MTGSRPKLLILTSTLPRWEGDSEPRFVLDLARALANRFEPVILAPMAAGCERSSALEGVRVERFSYAPIDSWQRLSAPGAIMPNLRTKPWLHALVPGFILAQLVALVALLRRERFDAIHCHWLVPQGLVLAFARMFVAVPPTLLTCHGADAFTLNTAPLPRLKRWILGRVDGLTVVSREIGERLAYRSGPPASHIPMGVDVARFSNLLRQDPSGRRTLLFIGRLAEKKGVDRLLHAMSDERLSKRGVHLRIVGDGPLRSELESLARKLGVADRLTFAGAMPHDRVAVEMQLAELLCAPFVISRDGDREGTPTVLFEAASAGLPIVTTDVGGCADIVQNGYSGWIVPPDDEHAFVAAIVEALDNPDRARSMAMSARNCAEEHSWERIADRYAEALHDVQASSRVR